MNVKFPIELAVWITALVLLACSHPAHHHFTLCPLNNLGLSWCPGCGLGRSLRSLMHLNISESIKYHWFGIPAFTILLHRIWQLIQKFNLN